jgi:hypothetical protein
VKESDDERITITKEMRKTESDRIIENILSCKQNISGKHKEVIHLLFFKGEC